MWSNILINNKITVHFRNEGFCGHYILLVLDNAVKETNVCRKKNVPLRYMSFDMYLNHNKNLIVSMNLLIRDAFAYNITQPNQNKHIKL